MRRGAVEGLDLDCYQMEGVVLFFSSLIERKKKDF